jgi:HK97 family phage prohead protease
MNAPNALSRNTIFLARREFGRKDRAIKHREFAFKADTVNDDGTFSGYASVFGVVDSYNEIVAPGAFKKSLAEIEASGDPLPALWQHRSGEPIGGYTDLAEDDRGLKVSGFLMKDEIDRAREAYALLKKRVVKGMSIGYYVIDSSWNDKEKIRTLKEVELVEISIVTFPANADAQVDAIKSKLAHGDLPTLPQFEQFLREAGFSKTKAAVIANRGLAHLLRSESAGEPSEMQKGLQGLKQALDAFKPLSLQ